MDNWCLIESDPGVFTELIEKIGVKDCQVEELYSLGDDDFEKLKPVYGLIFLFKWRQENDDRPVDSNPPEDLFFAKQVITNACATQAILSILLNQPKDRVDVGDTLDNFRSFCGALPPDMKGEAIASLDQVRSSHNSFTRPEPFVSESKKVSSDSSEDLFHFIAYVPFKGKIYELDGLKPGPILLGEYDDLEKWTSEVRPHIQKRIERYSTSEIRFNLMALVKDQRVVLQDIIDKRNTRVQDMEKLLENKNDVTSDSSFRCISVDDEKGFEKLLDEKDYKSIKAQLEHEQREIKQDKSSLDVTKQKFIQWNQENQRRKHNYVPLCVAMLKILAKKGALQGAIDQAREKDRERRQRQAQEQNNNKA